MRGNSATLPDAERPVKWAFRQGAVHMTLEEARDQYLHAMLTGKKPIKRKATQATLTRYRENLNRFVRWVIMKKGRSNVTLFNVALVEGYLEFRDTERKVSPNTLSLDSVILRGFAAWGAKMHFWRRDDIEDITYHLKPKKFPRPLNGPHIDAIMKLRLNVEESALRALLFWGALRNMEVTGARLQDVFPPMRLSDTEATTAKVRVIGKGAKERYVDLNDEGWVDLEPHIRARMESGARREDHIFVTEPELFRRVGRPLKATREHQAIPWSDRIVQRRVHSWAEKVGMGPVTPHVMRHTFACAFLEDNPEEILTLRDQLGHSSVQTTQVYAQMTSAHRSRAVQKMRGFRDTTVRHDSATPDTLGEGPPNTA